MRNSIAFVLTGVMTLAAAGVANGAPPFASGLTDTHPKVKIDPNPKGVPPGVVELVGGVVVMEGDDTIVTTLDPANGDYGIDIGGQMPLIGQRFYQIYPDDFDGLAVFTTFPDLLQGGLAYSVSAGWSGVQGIGLGAGGNQGSGYGSAGRLISVINMNDTDTYNSMDENDIFFHAVFGQEFTHTWLSFMRFVDPNTDTESSELLGRDGAHWSAIFHSGGSVMDGMEFTDNGDGTFTAGQNSVRYGPLDLYAMGILAPEEVTDMYIIRNAQYADGSPVDPVNDGWTGQISPGTVITGERFDVSIDYIIDAHGPRVPAWNEENEDYRVAVILVTRPGETVADAMAKIDKLNTGRIAWENTHAAWTDHRSTMCTEITGPCPLAVARVGNLQIEESPDDSDNDGIIEPREKIRVGLTVENNGLEEAIATLTVSANVPGVRVPDPIELPVIATAQTIGHTFDIEIDGEACGEDIELMVETQIEARTWRQVGKFRPGVVESERRENFDDPADWGGDPDGTDSVVQGAWAHGIPASTFFAGRLLQPTGGADGVFDGAWFTGPAGDWDEGELHGESTLESAPIDMSELYAPILRFNVWYVAYDRSLTALTPSPLDHLIIEGSSDGGETWIELDRMTGGPRFWEQHEVPLTGVEPTADVRIRFRAIDTDGPDTRLVEIGVDDVSFISLSAVCALGPDGGGCCRVSQSQESSRGMWLLIIATGLCLARRRRRQPGAGRKD